MTGVPVFTIPVEAIKPLVAESIMAQLTGDQKEAIIKEALEFLLKPVRQSGIYGRADRSPLQEAFETATLQVAAELARELIAENPEIRQRVKDTIRDSIEVVLADRSVFANAIGSAVDRALRDEP
jgi:hypothetical protein